MKRKIDTDWTDSLRSAIENAEVTPSAESWERLSAALPVRRKAAWAPYAALAAACAAIVAGIFLFQPQKTSLQEDVTVVSNGTPVAQAPEIQPLQQPEAVSEPVADVPAQSVRPLRQAAPVAQAEPEAPQPVAQRSEPAPQQPAATAQPATPEQPVSPELSTTPEQPANPEQPAVHQEPMAEPVAEPVREQKAEQAVVVLKKETPRRKMSISLSGGGLGGNPGATITHSGRYTAAAVRTKAGDEVLEATPARVTDISELIEHQVPVKLGINIDVPVGRKSYIGSGVEYFYLRSSFAEEKQILHWLGVPLNFKYRLVETPTWIAGLGAGATAETCLNASLLGREYKESAQFSAKLFADLRLALTPALSLYACPELSYYFTETNLPIYRSGKPVSFGITAGLAIDL